MTIKCIGEVPKITMEPVVLSGPLFESAKQKYWESSKDGGHYNIFYLRDEGLGMAAIRSIFPDCKADTLNFILFSTSGVHGSYTTLEEVETGLKNYPNGPPPNSDEEWPDDYHGDDVTFVIVQPRLVTMRYGNVRVTLDDIAWLKKLRESSWQVVGEIGRSES